MNKFVIVSMLLSLSTLSYANEPGAAPTAPAAQTAPAANMPHMPKMPHSKESTKPEALAVDAACTQESATANCGNEKVGTGLMKCIHAYRTSHKEFKLSDGCKSAMKAIGASHKTM